MALILNNPMPTTGALLVTNPRNPQDKFYRWLGRNYTISGKSLVKRKRALRSGSKEAKKYNQKATWSKYKRIYDALPADSSKRKGIVKWHAKDKETRMKDDKKSRKVMMDKIFSQGSKRKKSTTRRKKSTRKSATSKMSAAAKKKAAATYKKSRSKKRYQNLVKKYGMKDASAIVKLAKSAKSSSSSSTKRGKSMAKKQSWQSLVKKHGVAKASKLYKKNPKKSKRKNPVLKSKPKFEALAYPDSKIGKKLLKIVAAAGKNLAVNATKADINKYLSGLKVPTGYKSVLANDIHAALSSFDKKSLLSRTGAAGDDVSGQFALRSLAKQMYNDLGGLPVKVSTGGVVFADSNMGGTIEDEKAVNAYVRKLSWLKPSVKKQLKMLYGDLVQNYDNASVKAIEETAIKLLGEDDDRYSEASLRKRRKKSSSRRKKSSSRRKTRSRRKSRRTGGKGQWQKLVKKHGVKKAAKMYKKSKRRTRRNPKGALALSNPMKLLKNPLGIFKNSDSLADGVLNVFRKGEQLVSDIPVLNFAAPLVFVGSVGATAGLIHYQVNKHVGAQLASYYSQVPLVGEYLVKAQSTSNGAVVWATLRGLCALQDRYFANLPQIVDKQSADVLGAAATLTGACIDAVAFFQAGGGVPFLKDLPYIGQYFGDGGQFLLHRNMGAVAMGSDGDYHYPAGAHGSGGPFYAQMGAGAAYNGANYGKAPRMVIPRRKKLVSDRSDSCVCPRDLAPIELKAAKEKRMDQISPKLSLRRVSKQGQLSPAAGKIGARWNWLRDMIGDDAFAKLAKLPDSKRREVIALMKERAHPKNRRGAKPLGAISMGAFSADELGAVAMSGHSPEHLGSVVAPLSGAANGVGGVSGFGGILFAGT